MIIGAILAGGSGSRLGSELPKQFLMLGKKPIIAYAVEHMAACKRIDAILVAVAPDRIEYTEKLLQNYPVTVIAGGCDRTETLTNILDEIDARFGTEDSHLLVSHDAARPFINERILNDNIDAAQRYGACGTATPSIDSVIESEGGVLIDRMPDRARFWKMQTPQTFDVATLKAAFAELNDEQRAMLTDGCNVCVLTGRPCAIVNGSEYNLKITTPEDLKLAQLMVDGGLVSDDL